VIAQAARNALSITAAA